MHSQNACACVIDMHACVCVCARVCMFVHTHTHTYMHTSHTHAIGGCCTQALVNNPEPYIRNHISSRIQAHAYIHQGRRAQAHVSLYTCVYPYMCWENKQHIHTPTHTTHTHTHTCIYGKNNTKPCTLIHRKSLHPHA